MEWIKYHEAEKVFDLRTEHSTYQMQVREYDTLVHLYYGSPVGDALITDRIVCVDRGFSGNPYEAEKDRTFSLDTLPQEYTAYGNGDYRINGLETEQADGSDTANLKFESYEITKGKYSLKGLPAMFAKEDEAQTLEIVLTDRASGLKAHLLYGEMCIRDKPQRHSCHGRNQYVLDFSRKEVVDCIYEMMYKILSEAKVSYIKWDMNRSITECYSAALPADRQGEVFHRYILGVYDLYERLNTAFPQILFESCASGGGRFDPGILYYAPQGWTSDDTDAAERVKIQYGTSMCYPVSSMGSHVSVVPNHQLNRKTPLHTRANVAYFGTFGYELDLNKLSDEEISEVKQQITFMKEYRELIQFGTFYRLKSPFEGNETVWMTVSEDKKTALVFWYRERNVVNADFTRVRLQGLDPDLIYRNEYNETENYGDELMNLGLLTTDCTAGEPTSEDEPCTDYESRIYVLTAK